MLHIFWLREEYSIVWSELLTTIYFLTENPWKQNKPFPWKVCTLLMYYNEYVYFYRFVIHYNAHDCLCSILVNKIT